MTTLHIALRRRLERAKHCRQPLLYNTLLYVLAFNQKRGEVYLEKTVHYTTGYTER